MNKLAKLRKAYPWPSFEKIPSEISNKTRGNVRKGLQQIVELIKDKKSPTIVEIGSEFGGSARYFIDNLDNPTVICIDKWPVCKFLSVWGRDLSYITNNPKYGMMAVFAHLCRNYKDNIICIRGDRLNGLKTVSNFKISPDLIYVDCNHETAAVLADLKLCFSLFPNAIICGDDWRMKRVKAAVVQFAKQRKLEVEVFNNQYLLRRR